MHVRCPQCLAWCLAQWAKEEPEAAQAAAAAATATTPMDIDNDANASAWGNSGWGDGSRWSDGSGLICLSSDAAVPPPPMPRVGTWVTVSAGPTTSGQSTSSSAVTSVGEASVAAASSAPGITLPATLLFELVGFVLSYASN
ncbi:hypothetical protein B0H14DRAFT_2586254 [Mycena olivaceomarginata]|nr:hypothetical protein B0H14DRAFT_2586254 [Mycena olivaceomarginata]